MLRRRARGEEPPGSPLLWLVSVSVVTVQLGCCALAILDPEAWPAAATATVVLLLWAYAAWPRDGARPR